MRVDDLHTGRLDLRALDAADLGALAAADGETLSKRTGVRFARPVAPPPLFGDELPYYARRLRRHPDELGWWAWLISLRETAEAVGVAGLGGGPDAEGVFSIGYSVYEPHQGNGYATEAMRKLLEWAFLHPAARVARATIPPSNAASIRVARNLGMTLSGSAVSKDVGHVLVFEVVGSPRSSATG